MSAYISFEIDSKSTDFDIDTNEISYPKKDQKNFLSKKRFQKKEEDPNQMSKNVEELIKEKLSNSFEIDQVTESFMANFQMVQENDFSSDDEISFESNECYFIKKINEEKSLLKAYYPGYYLFTKAKEDLLKDYLKGSDYSKIIRSPKRLPNFKQKHYIRVNIKRTFMNLYLLEALNEKLKKAGFITPFSKFPQSFVINVAKDANKILMNMTLKEIFTNEELYKDRKNFEHNKTIVEDIVNKGNPELNMILNRKFRCLFEEYLNSEEFGIDEINRLKNTENKNDDYYIEKYVYLAKHFIEFCTQ